MSLSIVEYFDRLQCEYLMADFRRHIYYSPKDRAYYKRVMDYKAQKINDIAERNHLTSILSNDDKRREYRKKLFDDKGNPVFMNQEDIERYYTPRSEFSYNGEAWILVSVDGQNATLENKLTSQEITVNKGEICRIL